MIEVFGGPAHGNDTIVEIFDLFLGKTNSSIITASANSASGDLPGAYCYEYDPTDPGLSDVYGFYAGINDTDEFAITLNFDFSQDATPNYWDEGVSLCDVGTSNAVDGRMRYVAIGTDRKLHIFDKDDDEVGIMTDVIVKDNAYALHYYHDHTGTTRDIVWLRDITGGDPNVADGAWTKVIDVSGHGDTADTLVRFAIGTFNGKSAPTQGGKVWVSQVALQSFDNAPIQAPLGSITIKYKGANGAGTDNDFTIGSGTNPSYLDVDDTPGNEDGDTTYDGGDTISERQGYAVADADGGDAVKSVVPYVFHKRTVAAVSVKTGVYDSTNYEWSSSLIVQSTYSGHNIGGQARPVNTVNGVALSESLFNDLEVVVEITYLPTSGLYHLTMAGLEYLIDGSYPLPGSYPFELPPAGAFIPKVMTY